MFLEHVSYISFYDIKFFSFSEGCKEVYFTVLKFALEKMDTRITWVIESFQDISLIYY